MRSRNEQIQELLARLELPKRPTVVDITVTEDVDSLGEEARRVFVVLDENEPDEMRRWREVAPIRRIIHKNLVDQGIRLWPYVRFVKPSELSAKEKP